MTKSKRTMQERGDSVKNYATIGSLTGAAIGGYRQYKEDKDYFDAMRKAMQQSMFKMDTSDMRFKPDKMPIAKNALRGAIVGGLAAGLWRMGTEVGGSMDDDSYKARLLGGFIGNPILGTIGSPLTALETFLIKNKKRE